MSRKGEAKTDVSGMTSIDSACRIETVLHSYPEM